VTSITCGPVSCSAASNPPQLASVEIIDIASNSLTATIAMGNLPVGQTPGVLLAGIAISPDGTRAYVSNGAGNQIWAIDTASNQIVATIPTAVLGFVGMSISPDGSHLYAASVGNPSVVDVIDTKTNSVNTSITLPGIEAPTQIVVTPDGGQAYVTGDAGHVWIINTATNATVTTIPISDGQPLLDIAFTPDGTRAYITCGNNNAIYVLDTTKSSILGHVTSNYPGGLAIVPRT
jgi:YVTN family beta-propeller protein